MKTIFSLLLVSVLLLACANNELSPVISVTNLHLSGDETDYAEAAESMPVLKVGDEVDVTLRLSGNGAELKTFQVNSSAEVKLDELGFNPKEVSPETDFTNVEKGRLRFVDGVNTTTLMVKAMVISTVKKETKLSFYLSSKAETDAAQCNLILKTQTE